MSKEPRKLVPELRFPEFKNEGEWKVTSLDSLCNFLNSIRKPVSSSERKKGLYPYYGASGIIDFVDNYLFDERLLLVGEDGAKWGAYEKTAFLVEGKYWVNNHAHVLRPKLINDKLLENYLVKLDLCPYITGAAPPKLTIGKLKEIPIPVPDSQTEQQKIASCLSSLDEVIAAHDQKLELLKDHKKGLMQNIFPREGEKKPKYRFPEFRCSGEWNETPLGDIVNFSSGGTPSKERPEYWNGTIPWISAASMHTYNIEKSDSNITELAVAHGAQVAKDGTLLILVRGSMLYSRIPMGIALRDVAFNQDVKALTLIKEMNIRFLLYELMALESQLLNAVTATGIGAGKLDTSDLKKFTICFPSPDEQQKIANCLSFLEELIHSQTQKIEQLKAHKKGLMQGLFPKTID